VSIISIKQPKKVFKNYQNVGTSLLATMTVFL